MGQKYDELIRDIYSRFNLRDIDSILVHMTKDVHWPNGWEGGYVNGHEEVRDYWTRQWKEFESFVEPMAIDHKQDGKVEVNVHQVAKDKMGNVLFDGKVKHIYSFEDGLIKGMEIDDN